MNKFIYSKGNFRYTGASHACDIKQTGLAYDVIVRGFILKNPKIIYIRINDFSIYQGLEYKRITYQFKNNLKDCEAYLKKNFKGFKLYDSYTINKLACQLKRDILNS